jgi:hypothetical protein
MWLRFDATTLWHFDAAERTPSTASLENKRACANFFPLSAVAPVADTALPWSSLPAVGLGNEKIALGF